MELPTAIDVSSVVGLIAVGIFTAQILLGLLLSVGYKYHLSARTNVFAVVANDSKAPAGTNKSGYALGLFHAF